MIKQFHWTFVGTSFRLTIYLRMVNDKDGILKLHFLNTNIKPLPSLHSFSLNRCLVVSRVYLSLPLHVAPFKSLPGPRGPEDLLPVLAMVAPIGMRLQLARSQARPLRQTFESERCLDASLFSTIMFHFVVKPVAVCLGLWIRFLLLYIHCTVSISYQ